MSESQAKKSAKEIQNEYSQIALKAGALQYDILRKNKELSMFNDALQRLEMEYQSAALSEKEQEKAAYDKAIAEAKEVSAEQKEEG